jgi:hypothetical protein
MNGRNGGVAYAVQTAVRRGSELLIFVPRTAHNHNLNARWCRAVGSGDWDLLS